MAERESTSARSLRRPRCARTFDRGVVTTEHKSQFSLNSAAVMRQTQISCQLLECHHHNMNRSCSKLHVAGLWHPGQCYKSDVPNACPELAPPDHCVCTQPPPPAPPPPESKRASKSTIALYVGVGGGIGVLVLLRELPS